MTSATSSTPSFDKFNPDHVPYQRKVIRLIRKEFDYSQGTLEILLSGAVGSAKSMLAAHVCILHVLSYPGSCFLLARRAMPDLKDTVFRKVLEHLIGTQGLKEGEHYVPNMTRASIKFSNGSSIISRSWRDKQYMKMRSLEISGAIIEELTENDDEDKQAYDEIKMRVGRLPHVPENIIVSCSNPDSPSHWAYDYFIDSSVPTRRVFYSVTRDNPFLPRSYVEQLEKDLDPLMAERMLRGKWIEIGKEVVYYQYDQDNRRLDDEHEVNVRYPVYISWDFNIAEGKPLSAVLFQYIDDTFHFFDEVVVSGMRTDDSCEELENRGLLNYPVKYILTGDAAGKARDTRSKLSDYDIIRKYFSNARIQGRRLDFELRVGKSNPPIRFRHNKVNAYCLNEKKERRLYVYKNAKMADKGLRLTQLKKGGSYIEDDSKEYQHISTAIGYGIWMVTLRSESKPQGTVQL